MQGRKVWSRADADRLRALYPETPMPELRATFGATATQIRTKAQGLGLLRSAAFKATPAACALTRPQNSAAVQAGRVGRCRRFQGASPVGTEMVTAAGVRMRRVAMTGTRATDWRPVYELAYVARFGPIPDGYALRVTNGDYQTDNADHVRLISRAEVMAENSITNYPPDVRRALRSLGFLKRAIKERLKNE